MVDMMLAHPMPMIVMWGPQLVQVYNDGYAAMAGGKHPAALGQPTRECWPEVWHINAPIYERVLRAEPVQIDDALFPIARHGVTEEAYFTLQFGPLRDDGGHVAGFLVTATETTAKVLADRERERHRAEQALREVEELHRVAAEAGRTGSWYVLLETRECVMSTTMARLMGFPPGQRAAPFDQWRHRVHPEDWAALEAALAASVAEGLPFDHEFRVLPGDGTHRWLSTRGELVREGGGKPLRLQGASVDVTERKRAEEQLRRSHDTFYRLIQDNPFGVYVVDADFRLREVSMGSQNVFRNVRPLLGRDFAEVLRLIWVEPFASEAIARFRHTLATGEPFSSPGTVEWRADVKEVEAYDWRIERITLPDGRFGVVCYFYDLSERQRWEAALMKSEARQAAALAVANLGTFEWDVRTNALALDDRSREIFGFSPAEGTRAEEVFARIDPEQFPRVFGEAQQSLRDCSRLETEYRILLPGGGARTVISISDVVRGVDGDAERMFGVFRDVTERRRNEEALRQSQERYRSLFNSIDQGFCVIEVMFDGESPVDYRFLEGNRAFEEQTGLAGAAGRTARELVPALEERWVRAYGRVAATGEPVKFEDRSDSMGRWFDVYAFRVGRPEERKVAILFKDITAAKGVEAALRESDEKLRVALGAAELGAWSYTFSDARWELDERAQSLYGTGAAVVRHDEAVIRRIMHPDDIPVMWDCVNKACDPGGDCRYECEYRILQPGGGYRWVRAWARVLFEGEGSARRAVRMIGSSRDVTDSKRREEAMRQAKEEAERASEAKSAFLATLSHELRTPLTPVLLTASLMESHPGLPPDLLADVATIRRNVELESRLISDLLDLTRIERGKLDLDERDVDLHLLVRSAADICQREASAKLTLDLRATRHTVRGDSTRLQQVFWNLINNAIKFTPAEGTITVRSADAGRRAVRVEVVDSGVGIDAAVLPRLFNAFEQGDVRAARQQAGLGLGLAISKRLAEAHGGTITASSAGRGRGATFAVEFPAVDEAVRAAPAPQRPAGPRAAARPLNVLLVEDHEPTLRVMERLLRRIGHRVTGVTSVASATAAARQDGFDLLISDLGLPDGSGLDVMRQLRDRYEGRAIALTGYGMDSDVAASREAGFAVHLTKPVDVAALQAAIGRAAGVAE